MEHSLNDVVNEFIEIMEDERETIADELDLPNYQFEGIGAALEEGFLVALFTLGPFNIIRSGKGYAVSVSATDKCSEGHAEYLSDLFDINARNLHGKGIHAEDGSYTLFGLEEFWSVIQTIREMRVCPELQPGDGPWKRWMPRAETHFPR